MGVAPPSKEPEGKREGVTPDVALYTPGVKVWQMVSVGATGVGVDCMLTVGVDECEAFADTDGDEEGDAVPFIPGVPVFRGEGVAEVVEVAEGLGVSVAPNGGEGVRSGERDAGWGEEEDTDEGEDSSVAVGAAVSDPVKDPMSDTDERADAVPVARGVVLSCALGEPKGEEEMDWVEEEEGEGVVEDENEASPEKLVLHEVVGFGEIEGSAVAVAAADSEGDCVGVEDTVELNCVKLAMDVSVPSPLVGIAEREGEEVIDAEAVDKNEGRDDAVTDAEVLNNAEIEGADDTVEYPEAVLDMKLEGVVVGTMEVEGEVDGEGVPVGFFTVPVGLTVSPRASEGVASDDAEKVVSPEEDGKEVNEKWAEAEGDGVDEELAVAAEDGVPGTAVAVILGETVTAKGVGVGTKDAVESGGEGVLVGEREGVALIDTDPDTEGDWRGVRVKPGVPVFTVLIEGEGKADKLGVCEVELVDEGGDDTELDAEANAERVLVPDELEHWVVDTELDTDTVSVGATEMVDDSVEVVDSEMLGVDEADWVDEPQGVLVAVGAAGEGEPEGEKELELEKNAGVGVASGVIEGDIVSVVEMVEEMVEETDKEGNEEDVVERVELKDSLGDAEANAVKDVAPVRDDDMLLEGVAEDEIEFELL